MPTGGCHPLVAAISAGEQVARSALLGFSEMERSDAVARLLATPAGRRWLRAVQDLDQELADRLLAYEADFQVPRRDRTLAVAVERASDDAVVAHAAAIAAGPAALSFWQRLARNHDELVMHAMTLVTQPNHNAAEATLHLLVLDPFDPFQVGHDARVGIAAEALHSDAAGVRGLAAEFLAAHGPPILEQNLDLLMTDESERVRGIAWDAVLRADPPLNSDRAIAFASDESVPVVLRRSALVALGTSLPTNHLADLLAFFVVHPFHDLAADAADLLYRLHRNPISAEAARLSPHADVREIAERLLDPTRGSPAAGGSRPGDPTRTSADIYTELIRQLERPAENRTDVAER